MRGHGSHARSWNSRAVHRLGRDDISVDSDGLSLLPIAPQTTIMAISYIRPDRSSSLMSRSDQALTHCVGV